MPTESELASALRTDETRLYAEYGLTATERMLHIDGTDVRVVTVAGDPRKTPVLLLHGIASVTAAAIPLIPSFGGATVVAVDWPGHGLSGPYRFGPRSDLRGFAVAMIDGVADAHGLDQFDIAAHSLGGQLALYYCLTRAPRVRRLVLLGAPGAAFGELSPPPGMRAVAVPFVGRAFLKPVTLAQYTANSAMTLGPGAVDPWPPELVSVGWYASQRAAFVETLPGLFRSIASVFGVRRGAVISHEDLATIDVPTLLLWGEADVFMTPEGGWPSWSRLGNPTLVSLDAGHAPWLNKPVESAEAVSGFLS